MTSSESPLKAPSAIHKNGEARVLTGITTTGIPHLGNYIGAIRPALAAAGSAGQSMFFLADYHALAKNSDPKEIADSTVKIAASWLAFGLDPKKSLFYRQSDIPEVAQLAWILCGSTAKGLFNRAHAYKAALAANAAAGKDPDFGINLGLYTYPMLMTADILSMDATLVPVGPDQVQHLEMAREIAGRFNKRYGEVLTLPKIILGEAISILGIDGRKMSKSYGNHIDLFADPGKIAKIIASYKTDSTSATEPKNIKTGGLFDIYRAFANSSKAVEELKMKYQKGIGWGEIKAEVTEIVLAALAKPKLEYDRLVSEPSYIENLLQEGAAKAREIARGVLSRASAAAGIYALDS